MNESIPLDSDSRRYPYGPIRRVRDLPPWDDDFQEPMRPSLTITDCGEILLPVEDARSREWLAHWLNTKNAWEAFGDWLDSKR